MATFGILSLSLTAPSNDLLEAVSWYMNSDSSVEDSRGGASVWVTPGKMPRAYWPSTRTECETLM